MNYIDVYLYKDTTPPTEATLSFSYSNTSAKAFVLTATGNAKNGIKKYEFYVDGKLEETINSNAESVTYNVTGKTFGTRYVYKVKVYDKEENYKESEEITVIPVYSRNETYNGLTMGTYDNPIIPKGFYPINENGAIWGTVDGYKCGLVIQDAEGNQFVWVPVDGTSVKFGKQVWYKANSTSQYVYDATVNAENVSEELPIELTPDAKGVIPNGGFYIGRFETGVGTVSKAGVNPYTGVNWSTAKSEAEGKYGIEDSNYGVVSTLIYGAQWDTELNFIQAYNIGEAGYTTYAINSVGYGNYGTNIVRACGSTANTTNDTFRQKNIYDMAGNVYDWTMEAPKSNSSNRVVRGGAYNSSNSAYRACFRHYAAVTGSYKHIGFRLGLYIKGQTES